MQRAMQGIASTLLHDLMGTGTAAPSPVSSDPTGPGVAAAYEPEAGELVLFLTARIDNAPTVGADMVKARRDASGAVTTLFSPQLEERVALFMPAAFEISHMPFMQLCVDRMAKCLYSTKRSIWPIELNCAPVHLFRCEGRTLRGNSGSSRIAFDEGANVLDDIPKLVEKIDLVGMESGIESDAQNAEESAAEAPEAPARKLYFVRVPRPPVDNSSDKLKKLTEDFQGHVAKIKIINAKVQVKRDETRALRKQMQDARALKGESQPEFEEKLTRLKQLQELRKGYQNKMTEIKNALKGLDCKSEEELDAKINEMENRISHSQIELKEEKALVRQIATLRTQREQIKAYDTQKSSLTEMENESSKIKAVIAEMDGEFSILKGERDSAQKIIKDIYDKLVEVEAGMKVVEEAQAEAVAKKNDALEKLDKARDAANSGMKPYRENRAFSLQVRDMVAAGQVEEAFALCEAQTDNMMSILASDKAYRVTYEKLWSEQRRTPVAEILPGSCATASTSKSKGPEGPRPVAQGAEKAKLLIADLLMQASKEVAVRKEEAARTRAMEPVHYAEDDDADDEAEKFMTPGELLTLQAKKAEKAAAYKTRELSSFITNPAARAAEVFSSKVELPTNDLSIHPVLEQSRNTRRMNDQRSKNRQREVFPTWFPTATATVEDRRP
eukprot:gene14324-20309_t